MRRNVTALAMRLNLADDGVVRAEWFANCGEEGHRLIHHMTWKPETARQLRDWFTANVKD